MSEGLVYKAVVGCLKGNMRSSDVLYYDNLEYLFSGICACLVFYSDNILHHSVSLRACDSFGYRGPDESHFFIQKLREVHRIETGDFVGIVCFCGVAVLLHPD